VTPITLEQWRYRGSARVRSTPPRAEDPAMRHLNAVRDIVVPIAGIAFFLLLFTIVL
jgi:hypothetical protein